MTDYKFDIQIAKQNNPIVSIGDFTIPRQKITFLFGESGIGKSILSKAVYGLLDPARLNVRINDADYTDYLNQASTKLLQKNGFFVFQEPSTHLNPLIKLSAQLKEGSLSQSLDERQILRHLWETNKDGAIRKILEVYPKPHRPSGGEKQRILLAMAFKKINLLLSRKQTPQEHLFVFDEPTGSLDNNFRNLFLNLLFQKFNEFHFTSLLITHDYSIISEIYDSHPSLAKQVAFKELMKNDDQLVMQDFAPAAYLDWLKKEKAKPLSKKAASSKKTVVKIAGGFEIFGKRMVISKDGSRKEYGELTINGGEMVYLKAASGAGKTTMAKIIMGLIRCERLQLTLSNRHFVDDTPKQAWQKHIWGKKAGMIFQHADEALNLNARVKEVFGGLPINGKITDEFIREQLAELFDIEINEAFLNKKVALLSGGQKQRLNLLRTLALDTDLIIFDEPLNGLDFLSIKKVIGMIQEKQAQGKAILMISHNEEIFDAIVPPESIYYLFSN